MHSYSQPTPPGTNSNYRATHNDSIHGFSEPKAQHIISLSISKHYTLRIRLVTRYIPLLLRFFLASFKYLMGAPINIHYKHVYTGSAFEFTLGSDVKKQYRKEHVPMFSSPMRTNWSEFSI